MATAFVVALGTVALAGCGSRLATSVLARAAEGQSVRADQGAGDLGAAGETAAGGLAGGPGGGVTGAANGALGSAGSAAAGGVGGASSGGGAGSVLSVGAGGQPVVIGIVGTQSGIVGASIADGVKAVQAWVAATNATGGLHGHQVKLFVTDDQADPARHRALVQQLVEQQHVIAFVYNDAPLTGQASVDYLTQKRIPVVGSELAGQWFYQSPMFFPEGATGLVLTDLSVRGVAQVTVPRGQTRAALLTCQEAQYCTDAARIWPGVASDVGLKVVANSSASLATPDFTAQCLNAQGKGAQVFIMAMDSNSVDRVAASCASIGYHPVYSWAASVTIDRHRSDGNLANAVLPVSETPWFLANNPSVAAFQSTLTRFAPGLIASGSAENGWVSAKLFERAASHLSAMPTSQDVLNGLWSIKNDTIGNLTEPLSFTMNQNAPQEDCWFNVGIIGGNWSSADNGQMHCR